VAAPIVVALIEGKYGFKRPFEVTLPSCLHGRSVAHTSQIVYTFSLSLESTAILPQLLLLRQTSVPTVLDSFYLCTLGSYRFFYILNWIVRAATTKHIAQKDKIFPISVLFGIIQTALYVDFAWVYWTRQRVKLRYGGVVDGEDFSRGWVVGRLLGRGSGRRSSVDEEDERFIGQEEGVIRPNAPPRQQSNSWGKRGISVSADDGLVEEGAHKSGPATTGMADPDDFEDDVSDAVVVEDERLGRDDQAASDDDSDTSGVYGGGAEWRDTDEAYNDFSKY